MTLNKIEYQGFRNLANAQLEFSESCNFIIGENGAGKTNLLEAIFYVALASSFRTKEDSKLIRFDDQFLRIDAMTESKEASVFYNGEKRLMLQGNIVHKLSEFIGWLLVTILTIDDIWIVRGAPAKRRAFLDWAIAKSTPSYLADLIEYRSILRQRNRVIQMLKDGGSNNLLEVYDEQLINYGNEIYKERQKNLLTINESTIRICDVLGVKKLNIEYHSTCPNMRLDNVILKKVRENEIRWGETIVGPHRDDLRLIIDGHPVKDCASEGEQHVIAIAFKLAEAEILYNKTERWPILLIDEVAIELDHNRRQAFFNLLKGQIFYASTQMPDSPNRDSCKTFIVRRGIVEVS